MRGELGSKVADGLLQQAAEQADKLKDKMDEAKIGVNSVREAMKTLGITSDAEIKKAAQTAKEAYDVIADSGKASQRELAEAWKQMAEAAIKANGGVADATITAQAKVHGYAIEVDKAGKAAIRTLKEVQAEKDKTEGKKGKEDEYKKPRFVVIGDSSRDGLRERKSVLADRQPPPSVEIPWLNQSGFKPESDYSRRDPYATEPASKAAAPAAQNWQSAWANQPQGPAGMERVVRVNLNLGGRALGDVRTDEAGAAAIDRLMRELESGMRQSGRGAGR